MNLVARLRAVIYEPILQVFGEVGILVYQRPSPKIGHFITSMEVLIDYVGAICSFIDVLSAIDISFLVECFPMYIDFCKKTVETPTQIASQKSLVLIKSEWRLCAWLPSISDMANVNSLDDSLVASSQEYSPRSFRNSVHQHRISGGSVATIYSTTS